MAFISALSHKRRIFSSVFIIIGLFVLLISSYDLFRINESAHFGLHGEASPAGYILPGRSLKQEMTVGFSGRIDEVQLLVATYGRPDYHLNDATIRVQLTNLRNKKNASEDVPISEFVDNTFYSVNFNKALRVNSGDAIAIEMIALDTDDSNAPTIWLYSEQTLEEEPMSPAVAGNQVLSGSFGMSMTYSVFNFSQVYLAWALLVGVAVSLLLKKRAPHRVRLKKCRAFLKWLLVGVVFPIISFLVLQSMVLQESHLNKWNTLFPLVIYLGIFFAVYLVFGRFAWAYLLSNAMMLAVYIANAGKRGVRGDIFLPSDLFAVSEASKYAQADMIRFVMNSGLVIFIMLAVLLLVLVSRHFYVRIRRRFTLRILALVVLSVTLFTMMSRIVYDNNVLRDKYGITNIRWEQVQNVEQNGLYQVFLMNSDVLFVQKPEGYSEKAARLLIENVSEFSSVDDNPRVLATRPMPDNIIVIMNESFYDLSQIELQLAQYDDMPFVDSILANHISGQTIVPVIAGGTCNSEFEFLTGFSTAFLPAGSLPYQQYVHHQLPSMAAVMNELGYHTIATHPNSANFWNRDKVYAHFGFEDFFAGDSYNSIIGASGLNRGVYTDQAVYDLILQELDQSDQPTFFFAVTIQNHFPYELTEEEVDYIVTGDDPVSESVKGFLSLIRRSDAGFQYFIEALEARDETTVVLFFGDHAPPMGAGFYEQLPDERLLDKYATPYFIYATSDYELAYSGPQYERISLNYLGCYFLEILGVEFGALQTVLHDACVEDPVFSMYRMDIKADTDALRAYEMLQYYYLFGSGR